MRRLSYKLKKILHTKISFKKTALLALICLILFGFIFPLILTKKTLTALKKGNFAKASSSAQKTIIFPTVLSQLTLGKITEIKIWQLSLSLVPKLWRAEKDLTSLAETIFEPNGGSATNGDKNQDVAKTYLLDAQQNLENIAFTLTDLEKLAKNSWVAKKLGLDKKLNKVNKVSDDFIIFLREILSRPHSFLILLQNTEELRASGGFIGSYARVDLKGGEICDFKIEDIYEPDGQFTGFVEAPAGAKTYLSGGQGLRLPDSNWHPDLPTSAQTTLSYFAFGQEKKIDSLITVNTGFIEKLLAIVGEVYLPDYGVTVTADNLTTLARADREDFFAGSKGKVNFLDTLFTNLSIKFKSLDKKHQIEILNLIRESLKNKDLQFFSTNPVLQKIFTKNNIAGELKRSKSNSAAFYFYSLESNVGINKANKKISREVKINLSENSLSAEIDFINQNKLGLLDYINYERLILDPDTKVANLFWNGQKITTYDEEIITNSQGERFKQVGFLIPVAKGESGVLKVDLFELGKCDPVTEGGCSVDIQKQSGLPPTPYTITFGEKTKNLILEEDELVEF